MTLSTIRRRVARLLERSAARLEPPREAAPHDGDPVTPIQHVINGGRTIELDYGFTPRTRDRFPAVADLLSREDGRYLEVLDMIAAHSASLVRIPLELPDDHRSPRWLNVWIPGLDGAAIYSFVRTRAPRHFIEVGSGNSTKFARRAIEDGGLETRIISIDPYPRAEVDAICDVVVRRPLEETDLSVFDVAEAGDIIFVDNSHRCLQNSDATVAFLEVLPRLTKGTLVGFHDIFLPDDYPAEWHDRMYSEQYSLAAWLLGGAGGGRIILPAWHVATHPDLGARLNPLWEQLPGVQRHGNGLWVEL